MRDRMFAGGQEVTRLTLIDDIRRHCGRRNLVGSTQVTAISKPRESKSLVIRERILQMIEQRPQIRGRNACALQRMQAQMIEAGLATEEEFKQRDKDIKKDVTEVAKAAEAQPEPDPSELWTDIYSDPIEGAYPYPVKVG